MVVTKGMLTSATPQWYTPPEIIAAVVKYFGEIDLDPCAEPERRVPAKRHCVWPDEDGLALDWIAAGKLYINPPYGSQIGLWTEKAVRTPLSSEDERILLVPARTDTAWFQPLMARCPIVFIRGRLKFSGATNSAPFPSALVYHGYREEAFSAQFKHLGVAMWRAFSPLFPDPEDLPWPEGVSA